MGKLRQQLTLMGIILAVVLVGSGYYVWKNSHTIPETTGVEQTQADEVHVHSDFLLVLDGQKFDLSGDQYQSSTYDVKHPLFHLHDGVGTMLHRHAEGITLKEFLESIGFTVTDACLLTDEGIQYCANADTEFSLYVNSQLITNWPDYITQEEDQILLYHGPNQFEIVSSFIDELTDEACIYSGTCPERGTPPYESCTTSCSI